MPVFRTTSRREFLQQSTAVALVAGAIGTASYRSYAQTPASAAAELDASGESRKFDSHGRVLPFAGNTVICHLPAQCKMRDAMAAFHDELAAAPFHHKLGLTTTDSYHMTVFPGANDQRRDLSGWPSYVPLDAPIEVCNRMVGERMAQARLTGKLPFRMRVDEAATVAYPLAATLRLIPIDDAENRNLRSVRDQLATLYGFRLKDHDSYGFHMTLSYQVAPFTTTEQAAYRAMLQRHTQAIVAAQPMLELGMPEFCTFPDMFRFEPRTLMSVG